MALNRNELSRYLNKKYNPPLTIEKVGEIIDLIEQEKLDAANAREDYVTAITAKEMERRDAESGKHNTKYIV